MTDPSGGAFFHDLIENVVIWEDGDAQDVAGKLPVDVTLAVSVPAEATEFPVQGLADVHDAHTIAAQQVGDAMGHDAVDGVHGSVVIEGHHADALHLAGEPDSSGALVSHHDDPSASSGA